MTTPIFDLVMAPDIQELIQLRLHGLDDFARLKELTELIDLFSRELPAYLAQERVSWLQHLMETYTPSEIQERTGLSANRIRKLLGR